MTARSSPHRFHSSADTRRTTFHGLSDRHDGDQVTVGRYPVVNVNDAWELYSTLGLTLPGIEHRASATAVGDEPPVIHQAGPRRLHDILDRPRGDWLRDGSLPAYGARVTISPDGTIVFRRGRWAATITTEVETGSR